MKRLVIKLFTCLFALGVAFSGFSLSVDTVKGAEKEITVFSWEDYMEVGEEGDINEDNDLIYKFEQQSGIKVNYITFATNEDMYNELIKNPNACDLICPSEYMIMKMKDEGLIKPYSFPENWLTYGSPYIQDTFEKLGFNVGEDKTYAIGYMWGTMGFIYNMDKVIEDNLNHWKCIWNEGYKNKVTIKDSIRDTYIMALGALYEEELLELKDSYTKGDITEEYYSNKVFEIFNRTDEFTLVNVERILKELKPNLYGFEVDSGKNDIIDGKINVNFAWSGDAVFAMDEADNVGVELGYIVPEEGSNVWFDGWVMPKNANEELALEFLDFISTPESAIRNMDYIGYTSCIAGEEVFERVVENYEVEDGEFTIDLNYFFGEKDGGKYVIKTDSLYRQGATQYPSKEVVVRCAVMDMFKKQTLEDINTMWNNVKFITFPTFIIWIVVGIVVLAFALVLFVKYKDRFIIFNKRKKGGKIIKIEKI